MLNEDYFQRKAFIASIAYTAFFRASKDFSQLEVLALNMSVEVLIEQEILKYGPVDTHEGHPLNIALVYHFHDSTDYWTLPPQEVQVVMNRVWERFTEEYTNQNGKYADIRMGVRAPKITANGFRTIFIKN